MFYKPSVPSLSLEDVIECKFVFRSFEEPEPQIKLPVPVTAGWTEAVLIQSLLKAFTRDQGLRD